MWIEQYVLSFVIVWTWLNIVIDFLLGLIWHNVIFYGECDIMDFNAVYFGRIPPTFLRNVGGLLHGVIIQKRIVFITYFFANASYSSPSTALQF
jgi:hypothetical protein